MADFKKIHSFGALAGTVETNYYSLVTQHPRTFSFSSQVSNSQPHHASFASSAADRTVLV